MARFYASCRRRSCRPPFTPAKIEVIPNIRAVWRAFLLSQDNPSLELQLPATQRATHRRIGVSKAQPSMHVTRLNDERGLSSSLGWRDDFPNDEIPNMICLRHGRMLSRDVSGKLVRKCEGIFHEDAHRLHHRASREPWLVFPCHCVDQSRRAVTARQGSSCEDCTAARQSFPIADDLKVV